MYITVSAGAPLWIYGGHFLSMDGYMEVISSVWMDIWRSFPQYGWIYGGHFLSMDGYMAGHFLGMDGYMADNFSTFYHVNTYITISANSSVW